MTALPLLPAPDAPGLTRAIRGTDQTGAPVEARVIEERPLTIYLNSQEIVTAMTIGDHPDLLAIGFLRNQGMLRPEDRVTGVDLDADLGVAVVRTDRPTRHEVQTGKKTRTSGCAIGTVFGDMMAGLEGLTLPHAEVRSSWLQALSRQINTTPSLYLEAGAIHGTVLCRGDRVLVYMEDVGRHNAVDKVAGWMWQAGEPGADKILYTTGRLTSEMVIKAAQMGVAIVVSRNGATQMGLALAERLGMALFGRAAPRHFLCYSGFARYDPEPQPAPLAVRVVAG